MKINLNDMIKVKLTEFGKQVHTQRYASINLQIGRILFSMEEAMPKIDSEGYTQYQLWDFMNIFGPYMQLGTPEVIAPLDIEFTPKST